MPSTSWVAALLVGNVDIRSVVDVTAPPVPVTVRKHFRVAVFIDWNSQLLATGLSSDKDPTVVAVAALEKTAKRISRCLREIEADARFSVRLRLYHGWHKGFEPSANRKAIKTVLAATDFSALSPHRYVVFSDQVEFGDCLIAADPVRLHSRLAIHLPNTLRNKIKARGVEEKMVDTALATDLLTTAYEDGDCWVVVVAEDDDLVPPIFVADALLRRRGSRAILLWRRAEGHNFLNLDGICVSSRH